MEEKHNNESQTPQERYATPEIDNNTPDWDTDEAPTEWVPTRFEKRIKAIPEDKWNLYQTIGGVVIGIVVAVLLFAGNRGVGAGFLISALLALLLPNILESKGRRKLLRARIVMIAVLAVSIVVMVLYNGMTYGWDFFTKKEETEAMLRTFFQA